MMRMKFQIQKMTAWTLSKWLDEMGRNISANVKEDQLVHQDLQEWKVQEESRENQGSEESKEKLVHTQFLFCLLYKKYILQINDKLLYLFILTYLYLGSLDFFMLMIADLRHDLEQLQARVFPNSVRDNNNRALPRYNYY